MPGTEGGEGGRGEAVQAGAHHHHWIAGRAHTQEQEGVLAWLLPLAQGIQEK